MPFEDAAEPAAQQNDGEEGYGPQQEYDAAEAAVAALEEVVAGKYTANMPLVVSSDGWLCVYSAQGDGGSSGWRWLGYAGSGI